VERNGREQARNQSSRMSAAGEAKMVQRKLTIASHFADRKFLL
jgi:hypothetical protein